MLCQDNMPLVENCPYSDELSAWHCVKSVRRISASHRGNEICCIILTKGPSVGALHSC